ncbi:MAG: 3-hydroxyacyl-CoA dehydrogenase family protein [Bacteroidales bacterium]|nr:3-hydroxyacyl-CoA dehydrogenase family protein [Bacteroidales bacterium]
MEYTQRLQKVSILGAAGKMGSGIVLLTAIEMADQMLKAENKGKSFILNAIDTSDEGLSGLVKYLQSQVLKAAEKKAVALRSIYAPQPKLIENSEIIDAYVRDVMSIIRTTTRIEAAYDSSLVFEAVSENQTLKEKLFRLINENNKYQPWFFTNTSSVPIGGLNKNAVLDGRILGFHFYNPPAVQKLVELITIKENPVGMVEFARKYAANLRKTVVPSNDIAGFIGNGHFMRDALFGIAEAERLSVQMPLHEAIYCVDRVTRDFLSRPMGIFQLIDYVGLDIVQFILRVMQPHIQGEKMHSSLLDELVLNGVKGGQFSDGSQKDGFLKYEKGKPAGVIDKPSGTYFEISAFREKPDSWLGVVPNEVLPWKELVKVRDKDSVLKPAFKALLDSGSEGASLAVAYALNSRESARKLVTDGVAHNGNDVNAVLLTGFFHAYGPINDYL